MNESMKRTKNHPKTSANRPMTVYAIGLEKYDLNSLRTMAIVAPMWDGCYQDVEPPPCIPGARRRPSDHLSVAMPVGPISPVLTGARPGMANSSCPSGHWRFWLKKESGASR